MENQENEGCNVLVLSTVSAGVILALLVVAITVTIIVIAALAA